MNKRVTIMDVAKLAGVNYSTVSLALRGDERIRKSTRDRVAEAASELDYTPNRLARSLSGGSSKVIGVMFTEMSHFFAKPLEALQSTFEKEGYTLSVHFSSWNRQRERNELIHFCENRVDGLIWASTEWNGEAFIETNELLQRYKTPYVLLGLVEDDCPVVCNQVGGLIEEPIRLAVSYLKSLGHQHIGVATATRLPGQVGGMHRLRLQVIRKVFADCNLTLKESDILETSDHDHGGLEIALRIRDNRQSRPTAILAAHDTLARGVAKSLLALGVKIPEDICLIGLDVVQRELDNGTTLASVSLEGEEATRRAARILMNIIGKPAQKSQAQKVIVAPQLILGTSCVPCA